MKIVKFTNQTDIVRLHISRTGNNHLLTMITYVLVDEDKNVGYCIFDFIDEDIIIIDCLHAPNYSKMFYEKLEQKFRQIGIKNILLNCSVDPVECKEIVMKRLNFYISLRFKVYDIIFTKNNGPLFMMTKKL